MPKPLVLVALLAGSLSWSPVATAQSPSAARIATHSRDYWMHIATNGYAVPQGEAVFPLAKELGGYFGSTDPELRDQLAYTILAVWIVDRQLLSRDELQLLAEEWSANLTDHVGEVGTDRVFKRSFSALCLSLLAERELRTPFLGEARFRKLFAVSLQYLNDEKDLRGFDAVKGWIHATAHTADLLAELAQNPLFEPQDQAAVLNAIAKKLSAAKEVFVYGEQDRLANVIAVIGGRDDFDAEGFQFWLAEMERLDQTVWNDTPPKMAGLIRFENDSYFLRAVIPHLLQRPAAPSSARMQQAVLKALNQR